MASKLLRNFSGPFNCQVFGQSNLCIRTENPDATLWVRGASVELIRHIQSSRCSRIDVAWGVEAGGRVPVSLQVSDGLPPYLVRSVVIHETLANLYVLLSLPRPDYPSKLLWRVLIALARLPGGAYLLEFLARQRRRKS